MLFFFNCGIIKKREMEETTLPQLFTDCSRSFSLPKSNRQTEYPRAFQIMHGKIPNMIAMRI